jgi:hypothetical protein
VDNMMTPDEVMDRAADLLDIHGWGRGRLRKETGELCLIGAMQMVVYPKERGYLPSDITHFSKVDRALMGARMTLEWSLETCIHEWNDNKCTGLDEATELLRNQAKRYREETTCG